MDFIDIDDAPYAMDAVEVHLGELVLVTPETDPEGPWRRVVALLKRARGMHIDAVFVCEKIEGSSVVRDAVVAADDCEPDNSDGVEAAYGQAVLAQRPTLPRPAGVPVHVQPQFMALPVIGRDGGEYGTLCSVAYPFQQAEQGHSSLSALRSLARMIGVALGAGA